MLVSRLRSKLQEDLVGLYMRLNGFFVSGFIVHSPVHGQNKTELDALALRLPFSSQPEREIGPDPLLELSTNHTDLVLCEVKSKGKKLRFNPALTDDPNAIGTVLRWSGLFEDSEVMSLSNTLRTALAMPDQTGTMAPTVAGPRGIRIRGFLFSPERTTRRGNQPWFLTGPEIMGYIWRCLCPQKPRQSCATTYDFQLWGAHEPIVRYFKSVGSTGPGDADALYAFVERD